MTENVGPCPLCGGPADPGTEVVVCRNPECGMETVCNETWQALSALSDQNRRRGEALERCRRYFDDSMTVDEIVLSDEDWSNEAMAKMCEEALK